MHANYVDLDRQVQWLGRFQRNNGSYRADWPYSGFRLRAAIFAGGDTQMTIDFGDDGCDLDCGFYVESMVDCVVTGKHSVKANASVTVDIKPGAFSTGADSHSARRVVSVEVRKVTEAAYADANGVMQVKQIQLSNDAAALMVADETPLSDQSCAAALKRPYKLLVIGDSISAAYGVDGAYPCSFTADLENVHHGYAAIVAEEIGAEAHIVAWSGKGVVRNYGDENQVSTNPMPSYYNRTLGNDVAPSDSSSDSNYWDPVDFPADVVLVMLGTNDYSTEPNPTDEQFTDGLIDFIAIIQRDYPNARAVVAACSPSAKGNQCANIKAAAERTGAVYVFVDPDCYNGGYGCDMHPNAVSQQFIADVIAPALKSILS